jgi:uncharacterized repeat protein (TIGR03803 family)
MLGALAVGLQCAVAPAAETTLYSFRPGRNGGLPSPSVIVSSAGQVIVTVADGGKFGAGDVFALTPPAPGATHWHRTDLQTFDGRNGSNPQGGLTEDSAGNFYGAASSGGHFHFGAVFRLTPAGAGAGRHDITSLYAFGARDKLPARPATAPLLGSDGNLYGTATEGGMNDGGAIYRLTPPLAGKKAWSLAVLHDFDAATDGAPPFSCLTAGPDGSFYGTAGTGGPSNVGVAYRLDPPQPGETKWTENVLHIFGDAPDGAYPGGGVTPGPNGELYGVTISGGTNHHGSLYELIPPSQQGGAWTVMMLYNFPRKGGNDPTGNLIMDAQGSLYGTATDNYGRRNGSVFRLSPPSQAGSAWQIQTLFTFSTHDGGRNPAGGVVFDAEGDLYGATSSSGAYGYGSVFQLTPD